MKALRVNKKNKDQRLGTNNWIFLREIKNKINYRLSKSSKKSPFIKIRK